MVKKAGHTVAKRIKSSSKAISAMKSPRRAPAENADSPNGDSETPPASAIVAEETTTLTVSVGAGKTLDMTEKVKELVRLAQEQGYLTYGDINDALPEAVVSAEDLDELYS